jgi:hypothetical protein
MMVKDPLQLPDESDMVRLPTFEVDGITLLKRLMLFLREGAIESVIYPVFPPNRSAEQALARLAT